LEVTTAGGLTSLYITQGTKSAFTSGSFSAADQKWGFSPDDDRFVFSYFERQSKEVTLLVDLTNKYNPKEIDTLFGPPLVQFSPSGKYLTYVTLQGQRTAGISIIDAETGIHAYDSGNLLFVTNVPPGNLSNEERDENDFGMVDWGFSPD